MTLTSQRPPTRSDAPARRLTRWSWGMVAALLLVYAVTSVLYQLLLQARGQSEGDLLAMTENVTGVVLETLMFVVTLLAPAAGVVLAALALRSAHYRAAIVPLALNAVFALLVVYSYVDALRMSFFAPFD